MCKVDTIVSNYKYQYSIAEYDSSIKLVYKAFNHRSRSVLIIVMTGILSPVNFIQETWEIIEKFSKKHKLDLLNTDFYIDMINNSNNIQKRIIEVKFPLDTHGQVQYIFGKEYSISNLPSILQEVRKTYID